MDDKFNTFAGWALGGLIVAFGLSSVSSHYFGANKDHRPEKMGYEIEGVVAEGGSGTKEEPIEALLAKADPAKGETVFKKCTSCHTINAGGANGIGPNLYAIVGDKQAEGRGGFAFSDALKSKGGTWDWSHLNEWLHNPKAYAPGTKMTFAGLSNPQDRANVIAYLNKQGDHPLPLPAAPAAGAASPEKAAAEATGADAAKAKNVPVQTEAQAAKQPQHNIAGEGAPAVSGTSTEKH